MPRSSERGEKLALWRRISLFQMQQLLLPPGPTNLLFFDGMFDDFGIIWYQYLLSQRYLLPRPQYRNVAVRDQFEFDLKSENDEEEDEGTHFFLNKNEFRQKYRMSRESLSKLTDLIKDHRVFNPHLRTRPQTNPKHQLMCLLVYLSTEGSGASNPGLRSMFRKGRGTYENFKRRCVDAIIDCLGKQYLNWPVEGERNEISRRFKDDYDWPNCVGVVDGTLLPLAFPPETDDAPDFFGRKYRYSLTVLVVNDDKRRIRYFLAGWPGKTHDNQVFRNSKLGMNPENFFNHNQYILGDSAFEAQWFCIPAFKKPAGGQIEQHRSRFNDLLATPRVISEHTIGIWKGRFPWLRSIRMKITNDPNSMRQILRVIKVTIILHNFLIEEHDEFEDSWKHFEDASDIDEAEEEDYLHDELNQPAEEDHNLRREQLLNYFNETNML
jgi:hypothetical protein